jgi:hypothetical protein
MATKRLTKYEKALNRLERVTVTALVSRGDEEREGLRISQAVEDVLDAHWQDHPVDCDWCRIYPPFLH